TRWASMSHPAQSAQPAQAKGVAPSFRTELPTWSGNPMSLPQRFGRASVVFGLTLGLAALVGTTGSARGQAVYVATPTAYVATVTTVYSAPVATSYVVPTTASVPATTVYTAAPVATSYVVPTATVITPTVATSVVVPAATVYAPTTLVTPVEYYV